MSAIFFLHCISGLKIFYSSAIIGANILKEQLKATKLARYILNDFEDDAVSVMSNNELKLNNVKVILKTCTNEEIKQHLFQKACATCLERDQSLNCNAMQTNH